MAFSTHWRQELYKHRNVCPKIGFRIFKKQPQNIKQRKLSTTYKPIIILLHLILVLPIAVVCISKSITYSPQLSKGYLQYFNLLIPKNSC